MFTCRWCTDHSVEEYCEFHNIFTCLTFQDTDADIGAGHPIGVCQDTVTLIHNNEHFASMTVFKNK